MTDYQIHLELRSGDCCVLCARRGDAGRKIRMHLTDGGRRYLPEEGVTAVLSARKSDGNLIYNRCDLEDGAAVFTVTPQTTAMPGLVECQLKLFAPDGSQISWAGFSLAVEDVVFDPADIPGSASESSLIADILQRAGDVADRAEEIRQAIDEALAAADRVAGAVAGAQEAAAAAEEAAQAALRAQESLEGLEDLSAKADAAVEAAREAREAALRAEESLGDLDGLEEKAAAAQAAAAAAEEAARRAEESLSDLDTLEEKAAAAAAAAEAAEEAAAEARESLAGLDALEAKADAAVTAAAAAQATAEAAREGLEDLAAVEEKADAAMTAATAATESAAAATQSAAAAAAEADTAATAAEEAARQVQYAAENVDAALQTAQTALESVQTVRDILGSLHSSICTSARGESPLLLTDAAAGVPLRELRLYGRTAAGCGETRPDGSLKATVTLTGRNLLPFPYAELPEGSNSFRGGTVLVASDGTLTARGTFTSTSPAVLADLYLDAGSYVFSSGDKSGDAGICNLQLLHLNRDGSLGDSACDIVGAGVEHRNFTMAKPGWVRCRLIVYKDASVNVTFQPMICRDQDSAAFEPYRGSTVSLSGRFGGVPVASGGNDTDAAGQQWLCDTLEASTGTVNRMVGWLRTSQVTSIYANGSGAGYYFTVPSGTAGGLVWPGRSRASSITELTPGTCFDRMNSSGTSYLVYFGTDAATESAALSQLQQEDALLCYASSLPTTEKVTVQGMDSAATVGLYTLLRSDTGAAMEAEYIADTKTYVDSKFAQLAAAMVTG